ncbi:MAG: ribonucleotide-diphosphate reductase subunit beta [Candidatus Pacebacteria bacterium]|jgi:ribonucleoside-diphosphate reductase beta chain|nr:ribonucleotide-diphosphate reductase subunit beta [Candidatus Paceibacterota bacterium]MBP9058479.1 ribonucleotide-diphosphate reductase subunit beta [Candidatus Paceibacterota bacterium]MBP9770416.1 ribonucleotide-diphosphate reductase subunit beta [Candidatus Paceibacterota bacterium]
MSLTVVKKRSGDIVLFDSKRIETAISKAYSATGLDLSADKLNKIIDKTVSELDKNFGEGKTPGVEDIQDLVEKEIAKVGDFEVAKAYILYREERNKERKRDIFKKRVYLKPYEYPELYEYVSAIRHSYWIHTEFNFVGDVQNFKVNVDEKERNAMKNAMLAIAQIEVAVKTFWGDIYKRIPKPEIGAVGATFAESEVRHTDAYSHLLEILGLNDVFKKIGEIPALMKRVQYLEKSLANSRSEDNAEYSQSILLFSLFIEHVSLFSQFLIIMSFNKHKNLFKGISNAVEATSKEEQIHGLFGINLINIIKQEHPDWFDRAFEEEIVKICREAFESEKEVVNWIFEKGELEFMSKDVVLEFIKQRFNNSLQSIGIRKIFDTDEALLKESDWFYDEVIGTKHGDFFNKKSINYNKKNKSITSDDLF